MARAVERDECPARQLGELGTGRMRPDGIVPAVDDEDGTAHARGQLASLVGVFDTARALRRDEHLRRRLERPAHGVLDLLGRVRLGEHLREEELEEVGVMLEPVLAVVLPPSLVGLQTLVERDHGAASGRRRAERQRRSDEDHALDALGMVRGEEQGALRSHREPDDECTLRRGRIQHRESVGRELGLVVGLGLLRAVRMPIPARIEGDDAAVAGEIGDLHLPAARVDDRPRGEEENRGLARPVDLIEDADAVAVDVAGFVRVARPRLLAGRSGGQLFDSHSSIQSSSS